MRGMEIYSALFANREDIGVQISFTTRKDQLRSDDNYNALFLWFSVQSCAFIMTLMIHSLHSSLGKTWNSFVNEFTV